MLKSKHDVSNEFLAKVTNNVHRYRCLWRILLDVKWSSYLMEKEIIVFIKKIIAKSWLNMSCINLDFQVMKLSTVCADKN